jgi:tRNA modification GTPase trmE
MDTIVAISTAIGVGAISIVRLSGKDAINIVDSIFSRDLKNVESHKVVYGYIKDNEEVIDEVLVTVMKSPKTYTLEDIVEISCHGSIATTKKILELIMLKGARLAEKGEFTKRAYLNGRIDLIEAEGINELLNSDSELNRKISINKVSGKLSQLIKTFKDNLLNIISDIAVNIDYPEYTDIYVTTNENIKKEVDYIENSLKSILKNSVDGEIIKAGIKTAIIGRPNVGKSSILNSLLDYDKAIVTNIPGTTRDLVEGSVLIDGVTFNLIDTAGIRETEDIVEKYGVDKSLKQIEEADLVILVLNNNEILTNYDKDLIEKSNDKKRIVVINKTDLENKLDISNLDLENVIYINTIEKEKIDILKDKIIELFNLGSLNSSDLMILTNARQINLVKESLAILQDVKQALNNNDPIDLIEFDLKNIYEKLSEMLGEGSKLDVIDRIFERFCVGK